MPGSLGKKSWARQLQEEDQKGWAGAEPAESARQRKGPESSVWARAVRAGFLEEVHFLDDILGA